MLGANSGSDTLEDERHVWIRAPFIMHDERDFVLNKDGDPSPATSAAPRIMLLCTD
jgi:hypothetical protein